MSIRTLPLVVSLAIGAAAFAQAPPPPPEADHERRELRVEIRMNEEGPPRIVVNGEAVPPERLRRRPDGGFAILDRPDGEVIHVIPRIWEGPRRGPRKAGPGGPGPEIRPMVGVVMDRPDPLLARHLRVDPDGTILIAEVLPGSPAGDAGLEPGDLVLRVGDGPATPEALARAVERVGVDGEISLEVLQSGERRRIAVRPRPMAPPPMAWDEERTFGRGAFEDPRAVDAEEFVEGFEMWGPMRGPGGMGPDWEWREGLEDWLGTLRDRMRGQAEMWRDRWDGPWGEEHIRRPLRELRENAERGYDELMHEMEHLEREIHERVERRLEEMNRQWREWRRELDRRMEEWRRDREEARRDEPPRRWSDDADGRRDDGRRPRDRRERDDREERGDRGRPGPPPPMPGRPA